MLKLSCNKSFGRQTLEKIAVIELTTNELKLILADVIKNKSYLIYDEIVTPINLTKDFEEENIIKTIVVKEILNTLTVYKKMIDSLGITEIFAVACDFVKKAKNQNGFLNELHSTTNIDFKIITPEEEINFAYTAAINTFNKPKALLINVNE